ncbi:RNA polymerase II elongation factor ELL3 [Ctenodactylus gundi]
MDGPLEPVRGTLRLRFAPAARTSLLLLRLSDAALQALQARPRQQVRPVIAFQGHRGVLRVPGPGWSCLFSFVVSQCGQEAGGGLDLVCQRFDRSAPNRLHCLGPLTERLTIWGTVDSAPARPPVQGHDGTEHARGDPEGWQDPGDDPEGRALAAAAAAGEVSGPLATSQGQPFPGSLREHHTRKQSPSSGGEADRALPSSTSQKRLEKKRPAPEATKELEEKRPRALSLAPGPLQGLSREEWEEDREEDMDARQEGSPSAQADPGSPVPEEVPDYLLQYGAIHSIEQRRAYEQDFETDYAEYRVLHARVGAASQRFTELGAEIKQVQRGTPEHKALEDKIVQEYKKFQKRYPGHREEKRRCEYLHQKLSHIKGLILEFEEKDRDS